MTTTPDLRTQPDVAAIEAEDLREPLYFPDLPTNPTNPTDPRATKAIYPKDSILEDWMQYARRYAESADCYLIGAILPVAGAKIGRNCWYDLDRRKYPNLYSMLAGSPGDRKTTAIDLVEKFANRTLQSDQLTPSSVSAESLFNIYETNPNQILIDDDANGILTRWKEAGYGKMVSKAYLRLYDCGAMKESFLRNKKGNDGAAEKRLIPETSTSILFGCTFNIARFQQLEDRDGMRRRFLAYVAEGHGRFTPNPPPFDVTLLVDIALCFDALEKLKGEFTLSDGAKPLWIWIQQGNRDALANLPLDGSQDVYGRDLTESPSHTLKIAMIFEACRWAKDMTRTSMTIQEDTLQLASDHVDQCLAAGKRLEVIGRQAEIKKSAESVIAQIRCDFTTKVAGDAIVISKTELVNKFCRNPNRRGAIDTNQLYYEIIPELERQGLAKEVKRAGKQVLYAFRRDEAL